jgi:hypothetical protein
MTTGHHMTPQPEWVVKAMLDLRFRDGARGADGYVDCYGFPRLVLAEQCGVKLPAWPQLRLTDVAEAATDLRDSPFTAAFVPVQQGFERAFDMAVMRLPLPVKGRLVRGWWHVGVVSRPCFITHMDSAKGIVEQCFRDCAGALASPLLRAENLRLFRHVDLTEAGT